MTTICDKHKEVLSLIAKFQEYKRIELQGHKELGQLYLLEIITSLSDEIDYTLDKIGELVEEARLDGIKMENGLSVKREKIKELEAVIENENSTN